MIKAVSTSLLSILLCGGVISQAQAQPAGDAGLEAGAAAEAVRRQAAAITIRKTIQEARAARAEGDTASAVTKYEEAWRLSNNLSNVEDERRQIQAELVPIRVELAKKAQSRGDLLETKTQLRDALRVNPNDQAARDLNAANDRRMAEREGRVPSTEVLEQRSQIQAERIATSTLVQDARFLIEAGRLDEAEKKLNQAVKQDPEHRAAFYYLTLIKEARFSQEARKRENSAKEALVEVEKSWNPPLTRQSLPSPNPMATTNLVHTSPARQKLYKMLDTIIIDRFPAPTDVDLSEALKLLDEMVRNSTIDKRGINFIIAPAVDRPSGFFGGGGVDPVTGLPTAAPASEPIDVEKFKIKFDPEIRNVTLRQFLDALEKVAKPPEGAPVNASIKYSVEDYAVVFSQRATEFESLYSRTFKLNPNTIRQGLEGVSYAPNPFQGFVQGGGGGAGGGGGGGGGAGGANGQGGGPGGFFGFGGGQQGGLGGGGGGGGGQTGIGITFVTQITNTSSINLAVREFFAAAGVDIPTNQVAGGGAFPGGGGQAPGSGKAMFFNDRTGLLFVRATLRDLDIIESAIQILNMAPPQVTIEAKFAEISQSDNKELGFDWYLGNFLMNNGAIGTQGGTAPSANGVPSAANPAGVFPVPGPGSLSRSFNGTDQLITGGLRTTGAPALATMTGILTDPQFRVVLRALDQRAGVDLLSAPKVTTVSGRQARINIEETATIVTGVQVQGLGGGGGGAAPAAGP